GCAAANSTTATVTVSPASAGGTASGSTTVCTGTNSTVLTLSGNTGTIQWQSSTDNSTFSDIPAATASTYTATNLTVTKYYRATVTSGSCASANSTVAAITVAPASVGGTVTGGAAVCTGTNSTALTLNGYTGTIQWQSSPNNSTFTTISGATSSVYTAINLTATTYYRALVTSGVCAVANSTTATVTVNALPTVAAIAGTTAICQNYSTTLTNTTSGGTWSSGSTGIATIVAGTGVVTGVAAGTSVVTYTVTDVNACTNSVAATVLVSALPSVPTSVTSSAASICLGASSNLNATSAGNNINWYTVSTGGSLLGSSASAANYAVTPSNTTTYYAEAVTVSSSSQTYSYTGSLQTLTVPAGVTSMTIDAYGAQGANNGASGGLGGRTQGTLTVTPGQTINIYVGGQAGYNGGGAPGSGGSWPGVYGGGATDVRVGGTALSNRVIVSGGGGGGGSTGASWTASAGGAGGGTTGGVGAGCCGSPMAGGGTQSAGGAAGYDCGGCGYGGTVGALGNGGTGSRPCSTYGTGSGGGGGYYGGGGGATCGSGGSGGGGSSYTGGVSSGSTTSGARTGNGQVIISWTSTSCPSSTRAAVTVTVSPASVGGTVAGSATVCTGTNSTVLTLSGHTGSVTKWQSCAASGFASGVSDIANTTTTLTALNLTATTYYRAVVTSGACTAANSATAMVTVSPASVGGTVSGSTAVCSGTNSATLTLNGYTGTIQWQSSTDNINFSNIAGEIASTYAATNLTATKYYRATVTSGSCTSATSTVATITVGPGSVGGTISGGTAVCTGTNSSVLTLSGNTGSIVWQSSPNNSTFTTITGATSTTYTALNLSSTTYYRAVVTSGACSSAYSTTATLTVNPLPTVAAITGTLAICQASASTLSTTTTGGTWSSATPSAATVNSSSGLVTGVSAGTSIITYSYTNGNGCTNTAVATVTVSALPSVPASVTASAASICLGSSSNLNATSAGNNINWYTVSTGGTSLGSSASAANYAVTPSNTTTYYAEAVTVSSGTQTYNYSGSIVNFTVPAGITSLTIDAVGAGGGNATASYGKGARMQGTVAVTPGQTLKILVGQKGLTSGYYGGGGGTFVTDNANNPLVIAGGGGGNFNSTHAGSNAGTGTSGNNGSGTSSGGLGGTNGGAGQANACNYNGGPGGGLTGEWNTAFQTGGYGGRSFINGGAGGAAGSYGSSAAGGFGGGGGSGYGTGGGGGYSGGGGGSNCGSGPGDGGGGGSYNAGTSPTNTAGYNQNNGQVVLSWNVTSCPSPSRVPVTVTVSPASVGGTIAGSTTICTGNSATLTLSGNTGTIQWQSSLNNSTFADITGATAASYTTPNLTATTYYRTKVTSGACALAYSTTATITVSPATVVGTISGSTAVCSGTNSSVITLSGNTGTIQWQSSADNSTFANISGATATTYTATNLTATKYYRAVVTSGACSSITSAVVTITVNPAAVGGTVTGGGAVCTGTNSTVLTLGGGYVGSIQWQSSANNSSFTNISAATGVTYTATNLTAVTYYRAAVTNGACTTAYSNSVAITINALPAVAAITGSLEVCNGASTTFSNSTSGGVWSS
ncbi:MAG: hypothetical protein JZU60_01675, partial [Ilumatobacteraceae bacterium]|nr:hypothetical protein [Ilumatobacteraceae bacterium]